MKKKFYKDLTGQKFGKLIVTSFNSPNYWNCLCDCGKIALVKTNNLNCGKTTSCGCNKNFGNRALKYKKNWSTGFTILIRSYKRSAKQRNLGFNLTDEECLLIFKQNCFYCNSEPKNVSICKNLKTKEKVESSIFIYNGIDRINSDIGYILYNVLPCCINCNRAKNDLSSEKFKELVCNIYNHWIKNESSDKTI